MSNSKGKCKVSSQWLHTWHYIWKHTIHNGFPSNNSLCLQSKSPFSQSGPCPVTAPRPKDIWDDTRCPLRGDSWVCVLSHRQNNTLADTANSHLIVTYNESSNIWGLKASYVNEAFHRRAVRSWSSSECIAKSSRAKPDHWTSFSKCRQLLYDVGLIWTIIPLKCIVLYGENWRKVLSWKYIDFTSWKY